MWFELASSWVTCRYQMFDMLEGLECLMYEAAYLVNAGNLRRAWFCTRRLSSLAHFLGFHRQYPRKALKQLDPMTRVSYSATWAHIVYLERYLSLLLGLPTGLVGQRCASPEKSDSETNSEWLEKAHSDIFERIIDRNQNGHYADLKATEEIDHSLQRVANSLPGKWWTPLEVRPEMDTNEIMSRVISGQSQIIHYNLLTILHCHTFSAMQMTGDSSHSELL